jgi:hypothetical protein
VPADQEHVHQGDHDRREREDLEHDLAADGVEQPGGPAHRDHGGVAADRPAQPLQALGGVVQALALGGLDQHEQGGPEQPARQADPFPAEHEPQQAADAGHDSLP